MKALAVLTLVFAFNPAFAVEPSCLDKAKKIAAAILNADKNTSPNQINIIANDSDYAAVRADDVVASVQVDGGGACVFQRAINPTLEQR
jgi:hypothetical protein